jgi:Uma2 family endonuclease
MIAAMALRDDALAPARQPPQGLMTYEEFLEWADEDTWAEWVDGHVILMPVTVAERHAAIMAFLLMVFKLAARGQRLGAVYGEPFQMRLPRWMRRGRSPDVIFVAREHLSRLQRHYLDGPADIVVEILSPESVRRDRIEKRGEYEQAEVPEYWLVDHEHQHVEILRLGPDGTYQVAFTGSTGPYQSAVLPQLRLRIEWLWNEPQPEDVIRELGIGS